MKFKLFTGSLYSDQDSVLKGVLVSSTRKEEVARRGRARPVLTFSMPGTRDGFNDALKGECESKESKTDMISYHLSFQWLKRNDSKSGVSLSR